MYVLVNQVHGALLYGLGISHIFRTFQLRFAVIAVCIFIADLIVNVLGQYRGVVLHLSGIIDRSGVLRQSIQPFVHVGGLVAAQHIRIAFPIEQGFHLVGIAACRLDLVVEVGIGVIICGTPQLTVDA